MVRTVRLRGGENELEALRDYQRDDDYRAIDWKATARRQRRAAQRVVAVLRHPRPDRRDRLRGRLRLPVTAPAQALAGGALHPGRGRRLGARAVVRTVRSLGPRHLALAALFRDEALDQMAEPRTGKPAELFQRVAAAETVLWRERLARDLQEAGALVLHGSPRKLTLNVINRYLRIKARRLL
jgi:uncharacterized protein (DUF58 family)